MTHVLCLGMGFSATALARRAFARGWRVSGTVRAAQAAADLDKRGYRGHVFDTRCRLDDASIRSLVEGITHLVISIPPDSGGDPALRQLEQALASAAGLKWIGYLSTIGVYGDHRGGWVDETTPATPGSARSRQRVEAEEQWLAFGARTGKRVEIFRLSGIYGPGRSAIDQIRAGTARAVIKPGQIFNRIHVDDIAAVLEAAMTSEPGDRPAIYNVTDDEPAPPQDVVLHAARLLGAPPPPLIPFAVAEMSEMGRSFYSESKRVRNDRIKKVLGVQLSCPNYRAGLAHILEEESRSEPSVQWPFKSAP